MLKSVCAINGMPMRRIVRSFTIVTQMLWEIIGRLFNFGNFAVQCIRFFFIGFIFCKNCSSFFVDLIIAKAIK